MLALVGPLGAGKTLFVQGLAEGLGIEGARVTSPTFVIAGEYTSRDGRRLHHFDLYRVESAPDLEQAGFLDALEPGAVVAVEWADRFAEELPKDRLRLEIERIAGDDTARRFRATASGPESAAVLARFRQRLSTSEKE